MFFLFKPNEKTICEFLEKQAADDFSYREIGASRLEKPAGYNIDQNRVLLGNNERDFRRAVKAINEWQMFNFPWIQLSPKTAAIETGVNVAVLINHFGFWSLNANRIVYTFEEHGEIEKYGFAYGTLKEHGERGEERFSIEFYREKKEVWYDIFAFSKPNHPLAQIGYPLSRRLQKQFAVASKQAMQKAVG